MSKGTTKPKVIIIVGPTASGKSDLAVAIAKKVSGEVVSADSRQVYRGMDIGTGKITRAQMRGVPHHLLDVASPKTTFTVERYVRMAKKAVGQILTRGNVPIICGGTGLYIDALVHETVFPTVPPNRSLRKRLEKFTPEELFSLLQEKDPERSATIDRHNKRRLIRALEIIEATGVAISPLVVSPRYEAVWLGISLKPEELRKRIHDRLMKRIRKGMIAEVKKLHTTEKISWKRLDELGLEYRFVSRYLQGIITKQEMIEKLETEIWRYSKRQMTWFKRNKAIIWANPKKLASIAYLTAERVGRL